MKSIRTKMWLGMMVLIGIVILLLWLFQIVFLKKFYSVFEIRNVITSVNSTVSEIEKLDNISQLYNSSGLSERLDNLIYTKQLSVQVINTSGEILFQQSSGMTGMSGMSNMAGLLRKSISDVLDDVLKGKQVTKKAVHPHLGTEYTIIVIPLYIDHSIEGAFVIIMPMAAVDETTGILKKQLILITIILLLVSMGISFWLSKTFSKPILEISKVAENYAIGNFDVRTQNIGMDEIGQLALRMNKMGEELAQNELLQKELIANVSHELRTPLTLIQGYAETLRDVTGAIPDKREKQLGVIIEESQRLGIIVQDILNLSRLQAGASELQITSFSLMTMINDIQKRYANQKEIRVLEVNGLEELKNNLLGDKRRIEQVFYNLINNAFNHTSPQDKVEIKVITREDWVRIEVIDRGEGIDKADIKHVFDRYYKGKRADGKKSIGTGLGLAIVKSILQMHEVPFGVVSKLKEGTTFWFELRKDNSHTSF